MGRGGGGKRHFLWDVAVTLRIMPKCRGAEDPQSIRVVGILPLPAVREHPEIGGLPLHRFSVPIRRRRTTECLRSVTGLEPLGILDRWKAAHCDKQQTSGWHALFVI